MSCTRGVQPRRRLVLVLAAAWLLAACDLGRLSNDGGSDTSTLQPSTACSGACHGAGTDIAPPFDTKGRTETSFVGVGAHATHLKAGAQHRRIECATCHLVPTQVGDPGHLDSELPAEVTFGALADGTVWDHAEQTCTNNYCHGATLTNSIGNASTGAGGTATQPVWTRVDGSQAQCTSCHGFPPPAPHPQDSDCGGCHSTMSPGMNTVITYPDLHVDGRVDVNDTTDRCDACHGSDGQAAPPKDTLGNTATTARGVGAHVEHLATNSTWHATIDCVQCHKLPAGINDQGHIDTPLPAEVTFGPLAGTGTWDGNTCTNTYCHGGGTSPLVGGAQSSPIWTLVDGTQRQCNSCHGAPPPPPHPVSTNCGQCHPTMTPGFGFQIAYPALHIDGKVDLENDKPCDSCHGSNGNAAPPVDTNGQSSTNLRTVGAHRVHLDKSTWRKDITCDQCHKVPTAVTTIGHIDSPAPAEVIFGSLAGNAQWTGTTCTNAYCHGATLGGGTSKTPTWTSITGVQSQCGSCHGTPPPPPHPSADDCGQCHNTMTAGGGLVITDPQRHIDGNVDVNTDKPCNSCHGSTTNDAPPLDTLGNSATATRGVGAHQKHLASTNRFKPVVCADCHKVPGAVISLGHLDTPLPAEVTFSTRAGTNAQWSGSRCTNTYCHGSTLTSGTTGAGGTATAPLWTKVDGTQATCASCHGNPPPLPHPQIADCGICHDTMVMGTPTQFADPLRHIDGNLDVNTDKPCNSCHGSTTNDAPPKDTMGNTATTLRGVGAHQKHLQTGSPWHKDTTCDQCHQVPAMVSSVGHLDSPLPAELVFSGLATGSSWNGSTCTSYCHGAGLAGGTAAMPLWTKVDGTQIQCASCHGNPPPAPHPQNADCGLCHVDVAPGAPTSFINPSRHIDGTLDVAANLACNTCHGGATNAAPPKDTLGNTATTVRGVGAHQIHVATNPPRSKAIACDACHRVPANYNDPGHMDTALPAELVYSGIATNTTWSGTTCTSYCHGATLTGGATTTPIWTKVDGTQAQCTSCHGAPPPPPHPALSDCGTCHNTMTAGNTTTITVPSRHVDGVVDVNDAAACNSCHGSATSNAPPKDTTGNTATTTRGVGAHQSHLAPPGPFKAVDCADCHLVPAALSSPGHVDTALPAELKFSSLAGSPTWNGTTCTNSYCHGSTLGGGNMKTPTWTVVDGTQAMCTSCHGNPPPAPHPQFGDCGQCHPNVAVGSPTTFTFAMRHVDGIVDLVTTNDCNACHGSLSSNAPPKDTSGNTSTTARGVGAHQAHLATASRFKTIACQDCHLVPSTTTSMGHLDSPLPAEVTFSARAGTAPTWDGTKCSNNYCHGSTLAGGGATQPIWTKVDGTQADCNSCHGAPPPPPHPALTECGQCHNTMTPGGGLTITDPSRHVDGNIDVNSAVACNTCHGSSTSNAPPKDTQGFTQTTARGVGAHQAHLTTANWHRDTTCDQCHKVPTNLSDPGHVDTPLPAENVFTGLAAGTTFNGTACTNSYCHGSTLAAGGTATAPIWTKVDGTQKQCTSCHGNPPALPHPQSSDCGICHSDVKPGSPTTFVARSRHIDGNLDVTSTVPCNACHGSATNDAPPKDTSGNTLTTFRGVGAHQAHVVGTNVAKAITCDECHKVPTDIASPGHYDTPLPAELTFTGLAAGSDWSGTTCTSYCHGSTLNAGGTATTPLWTKVDGTQKQCTSCHGAPPPAPHPQASDCGQCHNTMTPGMTTTITVPARHIDGNLDVTTNIPCNGCHGSVTNFAPPKDTAGNTLTTFRGVGAHQVHVVGTGFARVVTCDECHKVPTDMNAPGHIDTPLPAELTFTGIAVGSAFNGTTCTSYCHGSTLNAGGTTTTPIWAKVDGTQKTCTSCHGAPPPAPHPQITNCGQCHDTMTSGNNTTITAPARHIDGNVDVSGTQACNSCHGSVTNNAPPKDTSGNTATTARGVGAHQSHLVANGRFKLVACQDCHKVPATLDAPGHVDTALPAELMFSSLAGTVTWNGTTCTNSYCHGSTLNAGGTTHSPVWTTVNGSQVQCTSCHGNPPPVPHPQMADCGLCHSDVVAGSPTTFSAPTRHVDGNLDVTTTQPCNTCHGSATNDAPPKDTLGNTATTVRGVGAHQKHLVPTNQYKPVACQDCHKVPATLTATGHVDTALPAELVFSSLAGTTTTFDGTRCSNNYCHGASLAAGGTATAPVWTTVNGSQAQCTSCHGNPPPLPHPQIADCGTCHNDVVVGSPTAFTAPTRHVDGNLDVTTTLACNACHGSTTNDAPPKDNAGNTATTARGVGAHQAHMVTAPTRFKAVVCADCHTVPASLYATGHIDTVAPAEVKFSARSGTTATWTGTTCTNNYCHGASLAAGGTATAPVWTTVNGSQAQCTSCHGNPPPAPHPQNAADCGQCHTDVQLGQPTKFTVPSRHVDGTLDVTLTCNSCHGSTINDAPPKDTVGNTVTTARGVGAHQAHLLTTSTWHKVTTCDQCHKVPATIGAPGHNDTPLPAELTFTGLAAQLTGAAYNTSNSTCTNSYCHGASLAAGGTATAPIWTKVDGTQKQCTSCHGNPPPAPHPQNTACTSCHADGGTNGVFVTPAQHIDGTLQVASVHPAGYSAREVHGYETDTNGVGTCATSNCHGTALTGAVGPSCNSCHNGWQTNCTFCHGATGAGAPPEGVLGQTALTDRHVGAHTKHVAATAMHAAWDCNYCHGTKPTSATTPGHLGTGTVQAEVLYSSLNPSGTYSTTTATCSNLYCHGTGRTSAGTGVWTSTTALTCSSCHATNGNNMSGDHSKHIASVGMTCSQCHQSVIASGSTAITTPALHVNGLKEVKFSAGGTWTPATKSCSGLVGNCHGTRTW